MNVVSLCSGIGGLDLAVEALTGGTTIAFAEVNEDAANVFSRHWPGVPNLGDLTSFDWSTLDDIDILCGGYPCQPFSSAGKRKGTDDERFIWPSILDAIRILRPRYTFFENVSAHLSLGFDWVLSDLAAIGYDAEWGIVRASDVGACHRRARLFIFAWDATGDQGWEFHRESREIASNAASSNGGIKEHESVGAGDGSSEFGESDSQDRLLPTPMTINRTSERAKTGRETSGPSRGGPSYGLEDVVKLLPTPNASQFNYNEDPEQWLKRREILAAKHTNGNGAGLPLGIAVKLLPTPLSSMKGPSQAELDAGNPKSRLETVRNWGDYSESVVRWADVVGEDPPEPLDGQHLSPEFVRWMMGYAPGWIDGLTRSAQLRCLGNAVITRQAVHAFSGLIDRAAA